MGLVSSELKQLYLICNHPEGFSTDTSVGFLLRTTVCVHIFISYIETRFKQAIYPRLIFPSESVESLYDFTTTSDKLMIGACVPLSQIQHKCEEFANDSKLTRTVMPIHDMLRWFASTQIRNVGEFFRASESIPCY